MKDVVEWILVYLVAHKDVQDLVHKEIDLVIGQDRQPSYSDRTSMVYTQAVILEAMRLSSTLPLNLPHMASQKVRVGDFTIPKGYHLLVNFYAIHHDEKYWPQPEKFQPARFLSADGSKIEKSELILPFSYGKRSCPGEGIAKIEVFLYVTFILQRFAIESSGVLSTKGQLLDFSYAPDTKQLLIFKKR